jgi:hypothetical protein
MSVATLSLRFGISYPLYTVVVSVAVKSESEEMVASYESRK